MGALIDLQFRMIWRGTSTFLRVVWGFVIVAAVFAFRDRSMNDETLATMIMGPMVLLLFGISVAITESEALTWYSPLSPSVRTWARLAVLALTGVGFSGIIVSIAAATVRLHSPAPLLAAHLWLCWIGGGLLVLFVGELIQKAHPAVQLVVSILSVVPGVAMVAYYLTSKCPWEILLAEEAAVALLAALTRFTNVTAEFRNHEYIRKARLDRQTEAPEAAAVPAPASPRKLERTPSCAVLMRAGFSSPPAQLIMGFWFLTSVLPVMASHAMMGVFALTFAFQAAFQFWRPFVTVPLSRSKAFVLLTTPTLALWALMVAIHGVSSWAFLTSDLIRSDPDGLHFNLPAARRTPNAELSTELRRGVLPQDPERLASLMSEAYRAAYGLEIASGQILAVSTPTAAVDTAGWLRSVEKHFQPAVSRRIVEWRLLTGMAVLAMGLVTLLAPLAGRVPRWIRGALLSSNFILPMVILLVVSLESNIFTKYLVGPLRPLYVAIYDRPGTLTLALAVVSVALYLRHLRVFRTSEIVDPAARV